MTAKFLKIARQGRNGWKRYIVGVLLPFCLALIIWTPILAIATYSLGFPLDEEGMNLVLYGNPIRTLVFLGLMLISFIFGLYLTMKRVHKRQFMTLFNSEASVRWQQVIKGLYVSLGLYSIQFLAFYLINPSRYIFSFNASEWLPFTLLSLVFAPIVALSSTLIFAYLIQGTGLLIQSPLLLSISWGLIMGILSYVSEPETPLYWFISIAVFIFFIWVIIKNNGIELIWGLFITINLTSLVWFSLDDSGILNAPTIFKATEPAPPLHSLLSILFIYSLFYYICFGIRKNSSASTPE